MSRVKSPSSKTMNLPACNEALRRRGSLAIWFDPEMTWEAAPTGRRGRKQTYSATAVQACLTMKVLFGMVDTDAPWVRAQCRRGRRRASSKACCGLSVATGHQSWSRGGPIRQGAECRSVLTRRIAPAGRASAGRDDAHRAALRRQGDFTRRQPQRVLTEDLGTPAMQRRQVAFAGGDGIQFRG